MTDNFYRSFKDRRRGPREAKAKQAETASRQTLIHLHADYNSTSCKVTKPIRAIKRLLTGYFSALIRLKTAIKVKIKHFFRPLIATGICYKKKNPVLLNRLKRVVAKFPALHQFLLRVAGTLNSHPTTTSFRQLEQRGLLELPVMTPRACKVYQDLKASIENNHTGSA